MSGTATSPTAPAVPARTVAPRTRLRRRLRTALKRRRPWGLVLAQFYPAAALSIGYPAVAATLSRHRIQGVDLTLVLISCAVITPTLAQAVAAPLFLHLERVRPGDHRAVAARVLRGAPLSVALVGPLVVAAMLLVGAVRHLPVQVLAVIAGLLVMHVVMAALMVPAYALRAPVLLVAPWTAYVSGLLADPVDLWVAPLLGIAVQVAALAVLARGRGGTEDRVPLAQSAAAALRGCAEGLPLWVLPLVVLLTDPAVSTFGVVYLALLPAVVAQQLFFVRVVDPGWQRLDAAHEALESRPFAEARAHFVHLDRRAARGLVVGLLVTVLLSAGVVAWVLASHDRDGAVVDELLPAAALALLVLMQGHALTMVASPRPLVAVGTCTLGLLLLCVAAGASVTVVLGALAALDLVAVCWMAGLRRIAVRRAAYTLFWRGALSR